MPGSLEGRYDPGHFIKQAALRDPAFSRAELDKNGGQKQAALMAQVVEKLDALDKKHDALAGIVKSKMGAVKSDE